MTDHMTEDQVRAFLAEFERLQNSKDFDQVAPLIHPEALFRFTDGDFRGLQAIRTAFETTWAYEIEDEEYRLSEIEVVFVDRASALTTFQFQWSGKGPEGPFDIVGRGTSLIVMHAGSLKLLVEHLSR